MSVLILTHASSHDHVTPAGHPERVARIQAVDRLLEGDAYRSWPRAEAPAASGEQLRRAHDAAYVEMIEDVAPESGWVSLDGDTHMSPGSHVAALQAAGSNVAAVDAVMAGDATAAFCAVRPCGHHATPNRAMGFCLFDNVAVGALHAIEAHGLSRVAIVDFDVHHGNGTQDIFERDGRVFFASSHQMPLFPGTGAKHETGVGNICNAPLNPMTAGREMRSAYEERVLPELRAFRPELLMISAGFDAHADDPLANLGWRGDDFGWVTKELTRVAAECCDGRIVSTLEGGYDRVGLVEGLAAHLAALSTHAEGA